MGHRHWSSMKHLHCLRRMSKGDNPTSWSWCAFPPQVTFDSKAGFCWRTSLIVPTKTNQSYLFLLKRKSKQHRTKDNEQRKKHSWAVSWHLLELLFAHAPLGSWQPCLAFRGQMLLSPLKLGLATTSTVFCGSHILLHPIILGEKWMLGPRLQGEIVR